MWQKNKKNISIFSDFTYSITCYIIQLYIICHWWFVFCLARGVSTWQNQAWPISWRAGHLSELQDHTIKHQSNSCYDRKWSVFHYLHIENSINYLLQNFDCFYFFNQILSSKKVLADQASSIKTNPILTFQSHYLFTQFCSGFLQFYIVSFWYSLVSYNYFNISFFCIKSRYKSAFCWSRINLG